MPSRPRVKLTDDEALLWAELKAFRKQGFAFRRQVRIGPFTADFLCRKLKLIVELDGDHHGRDDAQWKHDRERDEWLRMQGYTVLRIWNAELRKDIDATVTQIENVMRSLMTK